MNTHPARSLQGKIIIFVDPEVSFHRFFRTLRNPKDRTIYRGKQDLTLVDPKLCSLLLTLQESFNSALQARGNVFERGAYSDFHLDYVDAPIISAFSFEFEERAFVALSIPLITALWRSSESLSRSEAVMKHFQLGSIDEAEVATIFFLGQLSFLVAHEFAHHDRGHFPSRSEAEELPNDLKTDAEHGSLTEQAKEIDADGWATLLNIDHWFVGNGRKSIITTFKFEDEHQADMQLLLFFMASICAVLLLWKPIQVDEDNVYKLSHPPQAARMQRILLTFDMWARSSRPRLALDSTQRILPSLIAAVEDALAEINGAHTWQQQVDFLRTSAGAHYMQVLVEQSESIRRR